MSEVVKQDWADLDAQLGAREVLISDLVSTVRDRVPDEEGIFSDIADARGKLAGAATPAAKAEADAALTAGLGRLLAIAECCPELIADETFIRLQNELDDAEKSIKASRMRYNGNVETYNICTGGFLVSFVAGQIGFLPREQFLPPNASAESYGEAVPDGAETEKIGGMSGK